MILQNISTILYDTIYIYSFCPIKKANHERRIHLIFVHKYMYIPYRKFAYPELLKFFTDIPDNNIFYLIKEKIEKSRFFLVFLAYFLIMDYFYYGFPLAHYRLVGNRILSMLIVYYS